MQKRILLVEDDARFREVFTHALRLALAPEQLDVAFVEADSLAEARERLREDELEAALIDIPLSRRGGAHAARLAGFGAVEVQTVPKRSAMSRQNGAKDTFPLGETRFLGWLAWGHCLKLLATMLLEREECS